MTPDASSAKIRVYIVDDHAIVRHGLADVIDGEPDMQIVGEAATAAEALAAYPTLRPDVTLVDLGLPDATGTEVIATLRQRFPQDRFIVLTMLKGDEDIFRAVTAGAQAYVLKDMDVGEITDAIRAVHQGHTMLPDEIAEVLASRRKSLSAREIEILDLIALGEPNKVIAAKLGLADGTIRVHLERIFAKLEVDDRTAAVTVALRRGIIKL